MSVGSTSLSLWDQFLQSGMAVTRETVMPYSAYILMTCGSDGTVVRANSRAHIKVYSGVHALEADIPHRTRDGLELAAGELVVCVSHHIGGNRWPEPRLEPAVRFSLVPPDNMSAQMNRVQMYACIPAIPITVMRLALERFGPSTQAA